MFVPRCQTQHLPLSTHHITLCMIKMYSHKVHCTLGHRKVSRVYLYSQKLRGKTIQCHGCGFEIIPVFPSVVYDLVSSPVTQATEMPPGSPSLNRMRNVPEAHCKSIFSASAFCMKPWMELTCKGVYVCVHREGEGEGGRGERERRWVERERGRHRKESDSLKDETSSLHLTIITSSYPSIHSLLSVVLMRSRCL